jgi:hypothetical protein
MSENFEGFVPANTTPVPDVLFDELLPTLKEAELKALLYIIRRTLGFKKSTDAISLTQFKKGITTKEGKVLDKGCGVKDRTTLIKALASLEDKGCIESIKAKTASGDDDITSYRIRFRDVVGNSDHLNTKGSGQTLPPNRQKVVGNSDSGSGQNRRPVVGNSHPQETVLQETVLQETDKRESLDVSADAKHPAPSQSSFLEEKTEEQPVTPSHPEKIAPAAGISKKEIIVPTKRTSKTPLVSEEEKALRTQVHEWVNRRRGYSIQGRGTPAQCRKENEACIVLANLVYRGNQGDPNGSTWEELDREWDHIREYDKYWSKTENKTRIGADAILQMHAQTIDTIRKQMQKQATAAATQASGKPAPRKLTPLEERQRAMAAKYNQPSSSMPNNRIAR